MLKANKEIVRTINKGFEDDDVEKILSCLADDVRWEVANVFTAIGKEEFRKQIRNENFYPPIITIKNEIAEGNFVAVEGSVESKMKDGGIFRAFFHNTYRIENSKIKVMISYLVAKS
jgi:ketosteroid isomerase-like protein